MVKKDFIPKLFFYFIFILIFVVIHFMNFSINIFEMLEDLMISKLNGTYQHYCKKNDNIQTTLLNIG